ncbi:tetratricopeptide repeat protein [Runella slithyformis]|uniref:tetratricopeptide repeat protein n=1 Tax=Runella slithyformis TaxID=106 RepID=UPI000307076B|nr:hypothetical protein [Runella slithyformis]
MEAQEAYKEADYDKAMEAYRDVSNNSLFTEPSVRLNLAHTYFKLAQLQKARRYYLKLTQVDNPRLASRAYSQLGVIEAIDRDTLKALRYFKESLRQSPDNQIARFNFEYLKKHFNGKEESQPAKTTTQQKEQTAQNAPALNAAQEVLKTEEKKELLSRLQSIKMSEAQAMMILEALKASEIQYLQQQKHRSLTSDDDSKGKW